MARKPTKKDLEENVRYLEPYQEAFFAMLLGESPKSLKAGDYSIMTLGLARASGGVIIEGGSVSWVSDWYGRAVRSGSPKLEQLASKVHHRARQARVEAGQED